MRRSVVFLLTGILMLAAWLRLDRLTEVPPSLYCDEASVGYDAWSIATYGKDQWGNTMPLAFKSFGDYKSPVDIYATALVIKLLGYSDFTVRLPSAAMGLANLLLLFFLARLLLRSDWLALASVGLLAVSPWHVQFSRVAWQTNFALGFFLLALIAFLLGIEGRSWLLVVAFALFGVDLYTYHAPKVFVPLFLPMIATIHAKGLLRQKRAALIGAALFLSAVLLSVARPELSGLARFQKAQFGPTTVSETSLFRLTGIEPLGQLNVVVEGYFQHFSPRFLFESGDANSRHSIQRVGETYWFDALLLPIGMVALLRRRQATHLLLLGWFCLAPLPAAIVAGSPHAGRAMFALGGWQMVSAMGLAAAWRFCQRRWSLAGCVVLTAAMSAALSASVLTYVDRYFNVYPTEYSRDWEYALKRVFIDYRGDFDGVDHVFVSDDYAHQPYMLALHYLKYDPEKFRSSVVWNPEDWWGSSTAAKFDKFEFGAFDPGSLPAGRSLVFASPGDILEPAARRGQVRDKDGRVALVVYEYSR